MLLADEGADNKNPAVWATGVYSTTMVAGTCNRRYRHSLAVPV